MTPGQVLIVLVVLVVWGVSVVAGYFLGRRKGRTAVGVWLTAVLSLPGLVILAVCPRRCPAETAVTLTPDFVEQRLAAINSIKHDSNEAATRTDSWIWRLGGVTRTRKRGGREKRGPLGSLLLSCWDGQQSK